MNRSPITVIVAALIIVVSMAFLFRWHVISSSIASGWCVFSLARTGHSFFRRGVLRWTEAILRALHRRVAGAANDAPIVLPSGVQKAGEVARVLNAISRSRLEPAE
jgi:hypothetical protein